MFVFGLTVLSGLTEFIFDGSAVPEIASHFSGKWQWENVFEWCNIVKHEEARR